MACLSGHPLCVAGSEHHWDQWVVGYSFERQRQFFSQMAFHRRLADAGVLADHRHLRGGRRGDAGPHRARAPPRREASVVAWNRLCDKLATVGLARAPYEGPIDFLQRVKRSRPELAAEVEEITRRYVEARYGDGASRDELRELARACADFRAAWRPTAPQRSCPCGSGLRFKECHGSSLRRAQLQTR